MREPDALLRRLQTGALIWCAALTAGSLALFPDRLAVAGGIVGGGVLTAVSFYAITSSIDALLGLMTPAPSAPQAQQAPEAGRPLPGGIQTASTTLDEPPSRPASARVSPAAALLRLTGRYALLGVLAYVMIARLRLHPVGVIVGASSLVASAAFEAVRSRPAR